MHATKKPLNIYFRVDASTEIGSGHVMRCLTLAEALKNKGVSITFICRQHTGNLIKAIQQSGFKTCSLKKEHADTSKYIDNLGATLEQDAQQCMQILQQAQVDYLIIDHYAIDEQWHKKFRKTPIKLFVIDDLANRKHDCDYLLDHNLQLPGRYRKLIKPTTTQFIGVEYLLLRREFQKKIAPVPHKSSVRILIALGGSDAKNISAKLLKILMQPAFRHVSVDLVIGINNPHLPQLEAMVQSRPDTRLHVQTRKISALMQQASFAITAGGITCYECLAMNLPALVITFADNQLPGIRLMDAKKMIKWAGHYDNLSTEKIADDIAQMIDSIASPSPAAHTISHQIRHHDGPQLIANYLTNGPPQETITLRPACPEDCKLLWLWANDPLVRKNAYHPEYIAWEQHSQWYRNALDCPNTWIYIMECPQGPIGQIRLYKEAENLNGEYLLGYSIAAPYRGYGLGKLLIKLTIRQLTENAACSTLIAHVKLDNRNSMIIFESLEFEKTPSPHHHSCCFRKTLTPA